MAFSLLHWPLPSFLILVWICILFCIEDACKRACVCVHASACVSACVRACARVPKSSQAVRYRCQSPILNGCGPIGQLRGDRRDGTAGKQIKIKVEAAKAAALTEYMQTSLLGGKLHGGGGARTKMPCSHPTQS